MAQIGPALLTAATAVAGYLSILCATPPNPKLEQKSSTLKDRVSFVAGGIALLTRGTIGSVVAYHALLTVVIHYTPARLRQVCPQPENVDSGFFTWTALSIFALLLIYVGAFVRLSAYGGLGRYFTFHLAVPGQLVTTGVYSWMQHPSYTGLTLVGAGLSTLFLRWDAAPACWISETALSRLRGWGYILFAVLWVVVLRLLAIRVGDEEEVLKRQFGEKWERWHRSTKRFIPGFF